MKTHPWLTVFGLTLSLGGCNGSGIAGPADGQNNGDVTPTNGDFDPGTGSSSTNTGIDQGGGDGFNGTGFNGTGFTPPPPPNLPAVPVVGSRPPPAISGGTLAISPDGTLAVAADPDRDKVYVINLASQTRQTIALERGAEPGRVAFDGAGRAHIALRNAGSLLQIDPANAVILRQTALCQHPRGVAYQASNDALLVACASGDLVSLAAADHVERARTFLDVDLRDVVITKDQRTLVSTFRAAELIEVDAQGKELRRITPASAKNTRFHVDPMTGAASDQPVSLTPQIAWRTALSADGKALMLHQRSQEDEVLAQPGGYGGGGCSAVTETTISALSPDQTAVANSSLGVTTMAVDLAASPSGNWLAVAVAGEALQGQASLQVYSTSGVTEPVPGEPGCGSGPSLIDGFGMQATAVAFGAGGQLLVQSREPAQLKIFKLVDALGESDVTVIWPELRSQGFVALDDESMRDTGHDLFHSNVGGGIACASCHPEGRDDGHTWTFAGFGPRRTQNMGGGLKGTEPFHWDGDMSHFQRLVDEVMTGRMGGFVVEPPHANALLGWIDHLPALKLEIGAHDSVALDQAARGKVLFESANCASCHSGSSFTNNASVDVGTGGAFQVPSLRGLGLRGPFMHDGCAKDLVGRFDAKCGGGDKHGTTSKLTQAEISDLAAYLGTL